MGRSRPDPRYGGIGLPTKGIAMDRFSNRMCIGFATKGIALRCPQPPAPRSYSWFELCGETFCFAVPMPIREIANVMPWGECVVLTLASAQAQIEGKTGSRPHQEVNV